MATIYDVAKRARVSTYTVSSVLNGSAPVSKELTERVNRAVKELNYTLNTVARSLHTRETKTIGMLIPDLANPYYAKVVRGAEDVLKEAGYSLVLGNTYGKQEEQTRYLSVFRAKQVDGLLIFICPGDDEEVAALVKANKPVVFVGRRPLKIKADSITADNAKGTVMAMEHLIGRGHRRIGIINGQKGLSSSTDRVDGWREAMRKAGLPAPASLMVFGDWTVEAGFTAVQQFLSAAKPPTAILTANLLMMTGALKALQELRGPDAGDIEVMSADDSEWLDVFTPKISTIATPSYEMGTGAAQLLLKRVKAPKRAFEQVVLQSELRVR